MSPDEAIFAEIEKLIANGQVLLANKMIDAYNNSHGGCWAGSGAVYL